MRARLKLATDRPAGRAEQGQEIKHAPRDALPSAFTHTRQGSATICLHTLADAALAKTTLSFAAFCCLAPQKMAKVTQPPSSAQRPGPRCLPLHVPVAECLGW